MSLKFPPRGSVHENRIKPLPLSLLRVHWGELGPGARLQAVEVSADLLENLLHGALGVELGTEGLAGGLAQGLSCESNWELFQGCISAILGEGHVGNERGQAHPKLGRIEFSCFPHHPHPSLPLPWDTSPKLRGWRVLASATSPLTWRTMPLLL